MLDYPGEEVDVFDFDELANHMLEQGHDASPSTLHGCLCGLLAAGAPPQAEAGLALLSQALELTLHGELAGLVMQLYQVSAAALIDEEFDFHPLLPDDEVDLPMRTAALAAWTGGFLSGFGQVNRTQVGEDTGEILKDFAAIAEAIVDEDEEADEEDLEGDYIELVEYVRFASLNIFMDSCANPDSGESPSVH